MRKVIDPAVLQVNGLSDMSAPLSSGGGIRARPVHEFALTWWEKTRRGVSGRHAANATAAKVGRMARLRGEVDSVETLESERQEAAHTETGR